MTGHLELRPASMPLCGPADTIELIGFTHTTSRHAVRREWIYVAVHRGHGLWTHVYEVVNLDGAFGDEIRLIRVMPGDRRDDARSWALARKGNVLTGVAEGGSRTASADGTVNTTQEQRCLLPAVP
jgi:hypothetical protein